jgi:hypothetical protein
VFTFRFAFAFGVQRSVFGAELRGAGARAHPPNLNLNTHQAARTEKFERRVSSSF